jgi:threonylcarbamoyladenosine tRNA methylthiotransferase MtaB
MESFSIQNFGCRVNQAEAFAWTAEFQRRGWRYEPDAERSGLVILNSCTLTARADREARKFIRHLVRTNPEVRVVVTGCLAERDPRGIERLPGVWKVVPNSEKTDLPQLLAPDLRAVEAADVRPFRSRALLKIQDGCNMACAFCVIPKVRGSSASVPLVDVLARVGDLARQGFREIVLTGIHLCSYGCDLAPPSRLLDLLRAIDRLPGEFRLRLSSLDPRLLPPELLEHMTSSPRVCPHFHLSLQHGSDRVLKAMGRTSTIAQYDTTLRFLRTRSPQAGIGADIIVGFPGETADDFRALEAFLEGAPISYLHVFPYSPRPGTPAATAKAVDGRTTKSRAASLRALSRAKNLEFRKRFVGMVLEAVVIRTSAAGADVLTPNYIDVRVPAIGAKEGSSVKVVLTRITERGTSGEIVNENRR